MESISDRNEKPGTSHREHKSIDMQLTAIYVFVDDFLKANPTLANWRRSNNKCPVFTDAQVITIALMQGVFGCATLKKTYQILASCFSAAFPHRCSYPQWMARLHALGAIVGRLIQVAFARGASDEKFYIIDGKPIPVCKAIRNGRVRLLREEGAYFGKGSTGWFFGFRLHVLVHISGSIISAILTPGNWSERDLALALGLSVEGGVVLVDLGYRSRHEELDQILFEEADLTMIHPAHGGQKTDPQRMLISSVRERVETTFSGLWSRFVDRVFSRSWNGLWSTIRLKMLHFNLCHAQVI